MESLQYWDEGFGHEDYVLKPWNVQINKTKLKYC